MLRFLADHPDEVFDADQLAAGVPEVTDAKSLAGVNGAFGNYLGNRELEFPWEWWYDESDGRVRFKMDAATAEAIKQHL